MDQITQSDVLWGMAAAFLAGCIITYLFAQQWVEQLQDHIFELEDELTEAQEMCDLGWVDCLCRPGVVDPNCAYLKSQASVS